MNLTLEVDAHRETASQCIGLRRHWRRVGGCLAYRTSGVGPAADSFEGARGTLAGDRAMALLAQSRDKSYAGQSFFNARTTPEEKRAAPLYRISVGNTYGPYGGWEKGSLYDGGPCPGCGTNTLRLVHPSARVKGRDRKLDAFDSGGIAVSARLAEAIRHFPGVVLVPLPADPDFFYLDCDRWLKTDLDPLRPPCSVCKIVGERLSGLKVFARLDDAPPSGLYVSSRRNFHTIVAPDLFAVLQDKRWRIREQRLLGGVWLDTHPFDTAWPLPELVYATPDFTAWFAVPGELEVPAGPGEVLLLGGVRMSADLEALAPYAISAEDAVARCRAAERGQNPQLRERLEALNPATPELDDALASPDGRAALLQIAADLARELDEQEAWFRDHYTDPLPRAR